MLQALFAEEVDPAGACLVDAHMAHPLGGSLAKIAAHKLEQAISYYSLDQLYGGAASGVETEHAAGVNGHIELLKTHRRVESALGLEVAADHGRFTDPPDHQPPGPAAGQALEPRGFDI